MYVCPVDTASLSESSLLSGTSAQEETVQYIAK